MKALHGKATGDAPASMDVCLGVLAAVELYPDWYPDVVRRVLVVDRDPRGMASRAEVSLHLSHGPLARDLDLVVSVHIDPRGAVVLTRIPHSPSDNEELEVSWRLETGPETLIALELHANLAVPRLLPLVDLADSVAQGFVGAAVTAIRQAGDL